MDGTSENCGNHEPQRGRMIISISTLALYLAASWALILIPGPDILYVLARGLTEADSAPIHNK